MKLRKTLVMALTGMVAVSLLTGCQSNQVKTQTEDKTSQTNEPTEKKEESNDNGKTLVVYYSATGNTEEAAKVIADETGGNLFEIEPKEPYSNDDLNWRDENSRVTREHENESERNIELVATTPENWDSYDTIFIGYPIWWGIAAWPVDNFVRENDFTNKTVIPFCTSASSSLGESGDLLAQMAGNGKWLDGKRFSSNVSPSDVKSWLSELK